MRRMIDSSVAVGALTQHPCRRCGGAELSLFKDISFEHASGSSHHHFDLLVCRACGQSDFFVDVARIEKHYAFNVVRAAHAYPGGP